MVIGRLRREEKVVVIERQAPVTERLSPPPVPVEVGILVVERTGDEFDHARVPVEIHPYDVGFAGEAV